MKKDSVKRCKYIMLSDRNYNIWNKRVIFKIFCRFLGKNKWKLSLEVGLELQKHFNDHGATLKSLDNSNIKELILM